ncbi:MAG: autotransporter outer membrane beta-barrel domain-containing protein [Opitutaceae bacterium]|nr:autotransporter outer membrane beta-barrel domain-containing protein [Opitutaceae bacterium]
MKAQLISSAFLVAGLFAGCSKPESAPAAGPAAAGPRTIAIQAGDTMKYDVTSIEAKPGETLRVVLTNTGSLPKDAMGHNWILLKSGSDSAAFATAAQVAKATNYVPDALKGQILAQIELLGPKQSGEVTFTAPTAPGEYPYLCSFPAHFQVGMKGVLVVK